MEAYPVAMFDKIGRIRMVCLGEHHHSHFNSSGTLGFLDIVRILPIDHSFWLVVWNMNFMTFHILGISSSN